MEYTDPISVWCWGCEPALRRIEYRYPDSVEIEHRMGGLFEDFSPMREYWTRMSGGRWKEAVQTFLTAVASQHRMPINTEAMLDSMEDFGSTWPACIAVKAAERQGQATGKRYLRRLREAGLAEGRPIHREEVQVAVAAEAGVDVPQFLVALREGIAEGAFREDLAECRARGVQGFPAFDVRQGFASVRLEGYQSWEAFDELLRTVNPQLEPVPLDATRSAVEGVLKRFGSCATREVSAILGVTDDEAELLLEDLEARKGVVRRAAGTGLLWEPPARP